jgi:hypothetical protein
MYRHGRPNEYPWSIRHTAVYHLRGDDGFSSRWIFLQPPKTVESTLASIFDDANSNMSSTLVIEPLFIHLLLLAVVESSWRLSLVELEREIETLVSHISRPLSLMLEAGFF